jgi:hypothetical protein
MVGYTRNQSPHSTSPSGVITHLNDIIYYPAGTNLATDTGIDSSIKRGRVQPYGTK